MTGLGLVLKAFTEDSATALSTIRERTNLSEEALRAQLYVLRLFGLFLGYQMGVKGPNEISRNTIFLANKFHGSLVGDLLPQIWGADPDEATPADYANMVNMNLDHMREHEPDEYRRVEEMRILAPKSRELVSQVDAYWKEIAPTRDATFANVTTKFSVNCGAAGDESVRSAGTDIFAAMLMEGIKRGAQDPRVPQT